MISLLVPPVLIKRSLLLPLLLLILSDLMMCFFCLPFTLISLIRRHWALGHTACQFIPSCSPFPSSSTARRTAAISVDRLLLVTRNSLRRSNRRPAPAHPQLVSAPDGDRHHWSQQLSSVCRSHSFRILSTFRSVTPSLSANA